MEQETKVPVVNKGRARTMTIAFAVVVALIMVLSIFAAANAAGLSFQTHATKALTPATTAWTYPTTTLQEPGYTGGTYITASTIDVEYLNVWKYSDLYSGLLLQELYDSAVQLAPNQTYINWAASSYGETPSNQTTFDPLTGTNAHVSYTWNVTLRPNIQWSDWTPTNAADTYVYSNHTDFSLCVSNYPAPGCTVTAFSHTFSWPSVTMNKYTMQSADLILSWLIMATSADYSSEYVNIVNVIPTSNLTAEFMLSAQSATFITATLTTPILPYHTWQPHDCASATSYAWNYSTSCPASTSANAGYDVWNVGYNPATGTSNDLIGSGPFAFTNDFASYESTAIPQGSWVVGDYWELYVNPHYFVQYVPSLEQYSPKIFELYTPLYLSESDAVTALLLGQVDSIQNGVDPTYIPTIDTDPNAFIFYQPGGAFGFTQLNSWGAGQPAIPNTGGFLPEVTNAPFNITAVRQAMNYATDKAYLASVVDEGYQTLGQPVILSSDAIWHNFTANQYSYNPTLAESMLASVPGMTKNSAGNWLYEGSPVTLNIQTTVASADPLGVEGNEIVAQEWDAIGIPTTVTQEAFASLLPPFFSYGYSAVSLGITGITGDPTSYLIEVYNATVGIGSGFYNGPFSSLTWNGTAYTGTQIDLLIANLTTRLNSITNLAQRISLADEIEGIADAESVIINFGYPVIILPFNNATFTGLEENSLPYSGFIYWNYLSFSLKTPTKVVPPSAIKTQLEVGVVAPTTVFTNGQFGNITVQVRNQYGMAEPGMTIAMGYSPTGMLLNISSDTGVTNAGGTYTWEFQVLTTNTEVWTADYGGEINITAAAAPPVAEATTVAAGLGWTFIDVQPSPVAFYATNNTNLVVGGAKQPLSILVYNPLTGDPISGYAYTIEALSGGVNLTTTSVAQSIKATSDFFNVIISGVLVESYGFANVLVTNSTFVPVPDYNVTEISGVTGSNGLISVDVQANATSNLTGNGNPFQTWLFLGAYQATSPVAGVPPYGSLAEVSSSFDPVGYGILEPAEIPLTVTTAPAAVTVSLSVSSATVGPSGAITVTATVTNSTTGDPVTGAVVTVYAQNDFGANRGYLSSSSGVDVGVFDPNAYFASPVLPGVEMMTTADGTAISTFSPGVYEEEAVNGALYWAGVPYVDPWLIPADVWELAAYVSGPTGAINSTTADAQVSSTPLSTPATPTTTAALYIAGSVVSRSGVVSVLGSSSYTFYVNTTENGPTGPLVAGVTVSSIATTFGTITPTSGTTSSAGTLEGTLSVPATSVASVMVITVEYTTASGSVNLTQTVYVVAYTAPAPTNLDIYYALIGLFAVLTVVFLALWIGARSRRSPPPAQGWQPGGSGGGTGGGGGTPPPTSPGGSNTSSSTGPGMGGSGPPGGT